MPRGRPRRTGVQHVYNLKLYLWEGEDDDLIAFLEGIPPRRRAASFPPPPGQSLPFRCLPRPRGAAHQLRPAPVGARGRLPQGCVTMTLWPEDWLTPPKASYCEALR